MVKYSFCFLFSVEFNELFLKMLNLRLVGKDLQFHVSMYKLMISQEWEAVEEVKAATKEGKYVHLHGINCKWIQCFLLSETTVYHTNNEGLSDSNVSEAAEEMKGMI